jgi:hypothetical protein
LDVCRASSLGVFLKQLLSVGARTVRLWVFKGSGDAMRKALAKPPHEHPNALPVSPGLAWPVARAAEAGVAPGCARGWPLARPLANGRAQLGHGVCVELVTATRTWSWSHSQKFARTSAAMRSTTTPVEADSGNVTVTVMVCMASGEAGP